MKAELAGKEILIQPYSPSPGITVAFIVDNGAPTEFLCFGPGDVALSSSPDADATDIRKWLKRGMAQ